MKKVKVNAKYEIILPEHRANRAEWYTNEGWEKKRIESMQKLLTKNDVLFYIGSEEGDIPALISMWGVKIALFEPNPKVWPNTKAIWEANKLDMPVFTYCGFASNKTTDNTLYKEFPSSADGQIISDHGFMELQNHNAPEIKIDDIFIKPSAITIDVEGSEWEVLKGAEQTLKNYKPKIWLSLHPEFLYRIYGCYSYDLRNWIKNMGYKEQLLDYQHEVHLLYT